MFKRSFAAASKDRAAKATKLSKRSYRDDTKRRMLETMEVDSSPSPVGSPHLTSAIITLVVGPDQRLFAAHEDVLSHSPFFAAALKEQFFESTAKRIDLPDEEPQVLSCVLEYLYKGDYSPRLLHDKRRNTWVLEGSGASPLLDADYAAPSPRSHTSHKTSRSAAGGSPDPTVYLAPLGETILRDTAVYCAAERYGLDELKRLALRKQGLTSGVEIGTVLRSARYAYAFTPDSDSRLRAHYLALIIRSRRTFKRSGTMQMEMEMGGKMFFDLFVAMCNHMDDIVDSMPKQ